MAPRDLFGVVVRVGGLALCLFGVFDLFHVLLQMLGEDGSTQVAMTKLIASTALLFLLGACLLLGADWLARVLYDEKAP